MPAWFVFKMDSKDIRSWKGEFRNMRIRGERTVSGQSQQKIGEGSDHTGAKDNRNCTELKFTEQE